MKKRTIAAGAVAAVALVGIPVTGVQAEPAPQSTASSVAKSKHGSYVVVMKGDPLTATFRQDELESEKAQAKAKALTDSHNAAVKRAGIAGSKKLNDYTAVANGFSVLASHEQAQKLAKDPNVLSVLPDELRQKQELLGSDEITEGPGAPIQEFLGVDTIWDRGNKGEGQLLGVIDTGIWPEHPSFADDGSYPELTLRDARGGFPKCDFGRGKTDKKFVCNNKLVGARQMLKTYRSVIGVLPGEFNSARDDDGHGTHTASTAAGNENIRAWIYDETRELDRTSGIAPRAQIVAYKGLGSLGGFGSDLAAAIDQSVYDGVDVINYSIGGGAGLTSADAISFLFATAAGVHVATSAGNSGPGDTTIGGPADLPWVTTVGASTQPRFYAGTIVLGDGTTQVLGSSVTLGTEQQLPLVNAADIGNELCLSEAELDDADAWTAFKEGADGAMVLCWRGAIGRSIKSYNVKTAGGEAMILSNVTDVDNYFTDNFRLPTVMVDFSEGEAIAEYIDSAAEPRAELVDTGEIREFEPAPSMAGFSSRGPNPSATSIIKPDITAPGVQVLAGASPAPVGEDYEPGQLFQAISGTSMSSPVMAGVFLLLNKEHPEWSPAAMKSAVMTTAYQDVRDNDRSTMADPFDFGNGHVDAAPAFDPSLVYDAGFNQYLGFLCGTPSRSDVFANPDGTCGSLAAAGIPTTVENHNYPSIGVSSLAGTASVTRTVTNVSGEAGTFTVDTSDAPAGIGVSVEPASLTLAAGANATYTVSFTNTGAEVNDEWLFGSLTWSGPGNAVRSNIAVYPTPFDAPDFVAGTGTNGSVKIPVKVGFAGTYTAEPGGLAANVPQADTVTQDPDQTFDPADTAGTIAIPVDLSGLAYARWSYVLPGDHDIDLFLYKDGEEIASSTAGGTNELIELTRPGAGDYILYVHGWQVVGGSLDFSIDEWLVPIGTGSPALMVNPETKTVVPGEVVEVTASWTGAPSGVSFGVVDHLENGDFGGQTVVQVTAP